MSTQPDASQEGTRGGRIHSTGAQLRISKQLPNAPNAGAYGECKYLIIAHWYNIRLHTAEQTLSKDTSCIAGQL